MKIITLCFFGVILAAAGILLGARVAAAQWNRRLQRIAAAAGLEETESARPEQLSEKLCAILESKQTEDQQELHRDREFMISRFLSDHSEESEILDLQARAKLLLHSDKLKMYGHWFTAWYVVVDNMDSLYAPGSAHQMEYFDALDFLRNTLENAVGETELGYCVEDQGGYLVLINFRNTEETTELSKLTPRSRLLEQVCAQALTDIQEKTGMCCRAALADPFWDIRTLRRVADDLHTLMDYQRLSGAETRVITFDSVSLREASREEAIHWERAFFEALVAGDLPRAKSALEGIVRLEEQGGLDSIRRVRQKMCMRMRIAADVGGCQQEHAEEVDEALARMERMTSFLEMRRLAFGIMDLLAPQTSAVSTADGQDLVQFIQDNYRDSDLSLMMLADRFGVSQSGISRAVKSLTGQKMVDYVHGLRIAEAKRLLQDTELTVYEICDQVGYNTSWTMTRAFKRYTGMTPGLWREQARAKAGEPTKKS